jgi:hypothetical protein
MTSVPHLDRGRTESESDLSGLTDAEVLERVRRGQTNDGECLHFFNART